jgi:isopenicillin N synthase-like dioxygenase
MTSPASGPPSIDIGPLRRGEPGDRAAAAVSAIHEASVGTGFFIVVGHGLEDEMSSAFTMARRFFDLPQPRKELTPRTDRYGFVPHAAEAIDVSRQSENTEYLDIGLADEVPLPAIDGFGMAVRAYQHSALAVGAVILGAVATALNAGSDFFAQRMRSPQCRLRFIHYPPVQPGSDGALRVPTTPHTDYGAITLLATDGVPGLEVRPRGGDWTPVEATSGGLIVNLGDMLARWTNDVYQSTPHRVVGPTARDRLSIPFFINPDPQTIVDVIPACVTAARPRRYDPVTAGAFLAARIDSSVEPYVDPTEGPVRQSSHEVTP